MNQKKNNNGTHESFRLNNLNCNLVNSDYLNINYSVQSNLNMGSNKIVHLSPATNPTDAVNYQQCIDIVTEYVENIKDEIKTPNDFFLNNYVDLSTTQMINGNKTFIICVVLKST